MPNQPVAQILPIPFELKLDLLQGARGIVFVRQPLVRESLQQVAHDRQPVAGQYGEKRSIIHDQFHELQVCGPGQLDRFPQRAVDAGHNSSDGVSVPPILTIWLVDGGFLLESTEPIDWSAPEAYRVGISRPDGSLSGPFPVTSIDEYHL